jgi:eukaryotic-like serine/threonine-protein kinase
MNYGRYRIKKELGRGMNVVYLAYDPQMDSQVALKVLRKDSVVDENIFQRFIKEAQVTRLVAHPNIVSVYDVGRDHGTIYIAMELLKGEPLNKVITKNRLSFQQIVDIGEQVSTALDYAHEKGIVHRDIKPANIILTSRGQVKITDFGIARIEDTQQTIDGMVLGTPLYMSPEQAKGQPIDGRSDLYSLGVILYELTTGERPFKGKTWEFLYQSIIKDKPNPPMRDNVPLPPCLSALILKSLEKNPNKRFQTCAEMKASLKACLLEMETGERPSPSPWIKILKPVAVFCSVIILLGGLIFIIQKFVKPKAELKVNSTPLGAQVFIDDEFKGKTPFKIKIPMGKHEVRLSLHDYYEWEAQLQLDEKGEIPLDVNLEPMK